LYAGGLCDLVEVVGQCDAISREDFGDLVLDVTVESNVGDARSIVVTDSLCGIKGPLFPPVTEDESAAFVRSRIDDD